MALTAGQVESVQLYSGVESQVVEAQEGTSIEANVWYKGDLVKFAGDGKVDAVATTGAISGIAGSAVTRTSDTKFDLFLIDPAAIYEMRVEYTKYSALAYVGNKYGLNFTTGMQRVDPDNASTVDIYIVGIHPSDKHADGSTGLDEGRVLVRFNYDIFIGV